MKLRSNSFLRLQKRLAFIIITSTGLLVFKLWQAPRTFPVFNSLHSTKDNSLKFNKVAVAFHPCPRGVKVKVIQQTRIAMLPPQIRYMQEKGRRKSKLILLWNKYFRNKFSNDFYYFMPGSHTFKQYHCPFSNCIVTRDSNFLSKADAVVFHASTLNTLHMPLNHSNRAKQIWIFYSLEAPNQNTMSEINVIGKLINWTMSYRADSDVVVRYGDVCEDQKLSKHSISPFQKDYLRGKTRYVVWAASNCHSQSRREQYIQELNKHIEVDVYGKCGNFTCIPRQSNACYKKFAKIYKFYLAFENSLCKDYITEKIFNVLNYDIVPVLLGGEGYLDILPPNSFVDAAQFNNPKDLANYLKIVGADAGLYNQYFKWKKKYKVVLDLWMCRLCAKLNLNLSESHVPLSESKLQKWWMEDASCHHWEPFKGFVKD